MNPSVRTTKPSNVVKNTRTTRETNVVVEIALLNEKNNGTAEIASTENDPKCLNTGIPFLDHMLNSMQINAKPGIDLICVKATGDLIVDDHHTVEDVALTLGLTIRSALSMRFQEKNLEIKRYGWCLLPMDEALAQVAIDISGRPYCRTSLGLKRESIGGIASESFDHFFQSLSQTLQASIHIDILQGANDHHRIEAAFKGFGIALGNAVRVVDRPARTFMPSTKGDVV